ncbi:hypothetical protein SS50377_26636 [Spironucleus salmonicida]|uniref:Uncharacterized protein n=1 Tax=Spironucleus salmonicida TaxID=348837 RepID=V6LLC5_9EUKA|nr:hypothetical protein SS50377_26636 [Spironucleus salmonicida]|eukprot:EST41479.1 Hypothetical protein SS50377_19207 [Spironucleus salmonicida]
MLAVLGLHLAARSAVVQQGEPVLLSVGGHGGRPFRVLSAPEASCAQVAGMGLFACAPPPGAARLTFSLFFEDPAAQHTLHFLVVEVRPRGSFLLSLPVPYLPNGPSDRCPPATEAAFRAMLQTIRQGDAGRPDQRLRAYRAVVAATVFELSCADLSAHIAEGALLVRRIPGRLAGPARYLLLAGAHQLPRWPLDGRTPLPVVRSRRGVDLVALEALAAAKYGLPYHRDPRGALMLAGLGAAALLGIILTAAIAIMRSHRPGRPGPGPAE